MAGTKRVTLKLIAQRAGTSIGTVDRALKDREGVRRSTKERVLTAARDLGYIPNPFSNALRRWDRSGWAWCTRRNRRPSTRP
jgi:LacI family transcriptional regulator